LAYNTSADAFAIIFIMLVTWTNPILI